MLRVRLRVALEAVVREHRAVPSRAHGGISTRRDRCARGGRVVHEGHHYAVCAGVQSACIKLKV